MHVHNIKIYIPLKSQKLYSRMWKCITFLLRPEIHLVIGSHVYEFPQEITQMIKVFGYLLTIRKNKISS